MTESERLLDETGLREEAEAVINDIKGHVKEAKISKVFKASSNKIYINLTTLEDKKFCIEMSGNGFKKVGREHDDRSWECASTYETPYSLLDTLSEAYRKSFAGELMSKLTKLVKDEERAKAGRGYTDIIESQKYCQQVKKT